MRTVRLIVMTAVLAGLISACGVRGDPEPPEGSKPPNKDDPFVLDPVVE